MPRRRSATALCGALLAVLAAGCGATSSGAGQVADTPPSTPSGLSPTTMITQTGPPTATVDSITRHDVDVVISASVAALRAYHGPKSNDEDVLGYADHAASHFGYVVMILQRIQGGAPADLVNRAATAAAAAKAAMRGYRHCLINSITTGVHQSGCPTQRRAAEHAAAVALARVFDLGRYSSQSHAQLVRLANSVR